MAERKNGIIYIARDLIWKIGKWNTKELREWLNLQKITSIFLLAGDYIFPLDIAIKISKKYKVPLYVYYVDEYYRKAITKQTLFSRIHKVFYRKKIRKIMDYTKQYFCICESMEQFYKKTFNKDGMVIMNTTEIINFKNQNKNDSNKLIISYIGNLECDRWKSLLDIADIIEKEKYYNKIQFNVYSCEKNQNIIKNLLEVKSLNYMGAITSEQVIEKIKESDILLHVEDFNNINIEKVKYSVSTKIPDSLASGKLLLAYGPKEVESMNYIERNNVGIVVNNKYELKKALEKIVNKEINKEPILNNAKDLVERNHRSNKNYEILNKVLK